MTKKRKKEIIDVVDKKDNVVGKARIDNAHYKGFRHRVSAVWIFNNKDEILLQKRANRMQIAPGKWDHSAAGHLKTGTGYAHAAKRELKEEIGVNCALKKVLKFENKSVKEGHGRKNIDDQIFTLFFGKCNGGFKTDKKEVELVKFFPVKNVDMMIKKNPEQFCRSFVKAFGILKKEGKIKC